MLIGAHVPTSGGLDTALRVGREIRAEALQIFPSAPLQWKIRGWNDEACAVFKETWPKEFKQVVFHGIYLTNLAGASADNVTKTITALTETLQLAPKIGVTGTVFHPGTYNGGIEQNADQIKKVIKSVLEATPKESMLLYENSAGSTIGGTLEDLAWLLENSSDKSRVGVCLDTCHAFAAGYPVHEADGAARMLAELDAQIGLDRLACIHANDSKGAFASNVDRHANIGEGHLGEQTFARLLAFPELADVPFILEVPGTGDGPDLENVDRLKRLRQ